jgi:class 3 adenylate cyclase/HAMP domain-containing protein
MMVHGHKATIRAKLTLQMLLVGVVPVFVLGGVAYLTMSRAVDLFRAGLDSSVHAMEQRVVGANLTRHAEDLTAQIDAFIEERLKDVVIWASDPLVIEAAVRADAAARARGWPGYPEIAHNQAAIDRIEREMQATRTLNPVPEATQYLKDQLAQSKAFKEVFFTDRNGYNAAISNMTSDLVQSDEEWWVTAWTKGIDIGGSSQNPFTAKTPQTPAGGRVTYDQSAGVWSIAISVRIDHPRTKQPLGVMNAVLDISAVQALTSRAAGKIPGGDVKVLVMDTGDLIADTSVKHDRKFIMSKDGNLLSDHFKPAAVINQQDSPRSGYLIGPSDAHGTARPVDQVIGYAKSGGKAEFKDVSGFEGLGWAAVVGQEKHLAFAALDDLTRVQGELVGQRRWLQLTILGVVMVATAGIFALGAVLGRRIAAPIQELSAAATRVSGGDLSVQVSAAQSDDEIGQLGRAFNDMTAKLLRAKTELTLRNAELAGALQNLQESRQRLELLEQLKGELAKFVPESVKKLLEQNPNASELEKKHVEVSVLFLDIAGYTKLSEQLEAKKLNQLVQTYFSSFLEIIQNHHGDINETAGDGLMVIFQSERSASDHALNATRTAFAIHQRTRTLNEDYGGVFPSIQLHMGINTGEAWVGATKLSSAGGQRWTFTATGPTTNIAARFANSAQADEIVVGATTAERMKSHFVLESLGEREFKNVSTPIRVYRVIPPGVYEKIVQDSPRPTRGAEAEEA